MFARCDNCKFWILYDMGENDADHHDDYLGKCRRYPPCLDSKEDGFPTTTAITWCGEYKNVN